MSTHSTKRKPDVTPATLPPAEAERYAALCGIVQDRLAGFVELANALAEIRESKLYRYEFNTWEEFVRRKFKLGAAYAYRLIQAGEIQMSPMGDKITNERQARALAAVPEADREQVLEMAAAVGPVTANSIANAHAVLLDPGAINEAPLDSGVIGDSGTASTPSRIASQSLPDRESKSILAAEIDEEGFELPPCTLDRWHRRNHIKELMQTVSNVKRAVGIAIAGKEWVGSTSNNQSLVAALNNAHACLKFCMPYTVCPSCGGIRPQKCTHCSGAGLLPEHLWKITAPEEIKAFRAKHLKAKVVS